LFGREELAVEVKLKKVDEVFVSMEIIMVAGSGLTASGSSFERLSMINRYPRFFSFEADRRLS
jgi:hypothetical protein